MPKFPFKRDDHYIYRSVTAAMETAAMVTATMAGVTATAIDVCGLRWDYSDGWWHEWHFSNRRVRR